MDSFLGNLGFIAINEAWKTFLYPDGVASVSGHRRKWQDEMARHVGRKGGHGLIGGLNNLVHLLL